MRACRSERETPGTGSSISTDSATGDQHQGQVARGQGVHHLQDLACPFQPCIVGDGMTCRMDADAGQWLREFVAVPDVDPSCGDAFAQVGLNGRGHSGTRLPCADNDDSVYLPQVVGAVADEECVAFYPEVPGYGAGRVHRSQRGPDQFHRHIPKFTRTHIRRRGNQSLGGQCVFYLHCKAFRDFCQIRVPVPLCPKYGTMESHICALSPRRRLWTR